VPFKRHLKNYIAYQARQLEKHGVDVRLNTEATAESLRQAGYGAVIAAVGSRPVIPDMEGINLPHVVTAQQAYARPERLGERVAVIGAGLAGCELAIYLTSLGHRAELLEKLDSIHTGGLITQGTLVSKQLREGNIPAHFRAEVLRVVPEGVEYVQNGEKRLLAADSVGCAVGQRPETEAAFALASSAPVFQMIGDCTGVSNIMGAVRTAVTVARDLGRK
jgi:pyruvate/2-oxoglutarate dehydrogenase complex dihydrolipoamide dehydrogenase (E3) component